MLAIEKSPQQLVRSHEDGTVEAVPEVLRQLRQIEGTVVSLAMTGICRTGKSYLLNRIADPPNSETGFEIGSTMSAQTKGIWVWARPRRTVPNSYILLMDTEGFSDAKKGDRHYDNLIFTLVTLLSSAVMYNAKGAINEDMLANLSFISQVTSKIKLTEHDDYAYDTEKIFPQLIILLRDFTLTLKMEGKKITADKYLENILDGDDRDLRKYFHTRKCFTFDTPGPRRTVLKNLANTDDSKLSASFLNEVNKLKLYVGTECGPKKLQKDREITGRMFATLVANYVKAVRDGVPVVESAFLQVMQKENSQVMDKAIAKYKEYMTVQLLEVEDEFSNFDELDKKATIEAKQYFIDNLYFDDGTSKTKLAETLAKQSVDFHQDIVEQSKLKCRQYIDRCKFAVNMTKKMEKERYYHEGGREELNEDVKIIRRKYLSKSGLGPEPTKKEIWEEFEKEIAKYEKGIKAHEKDIEGRMEAFMVRFKDLHVK